MLKNSNPDIQAFFKEHQVAVLATASKNDSRPHAAAVFYESDSYLNLYFLTKERTIKSGNLDSNPFAAMVIYDASMLSTAQVTGQVNRVNDPDMMAKALRIMSRHSKEVSGSAETPVSKLDAGGYVLYRLTPTSIRLADYKYGGEQIFEVAVPAEEQLDNY